MIRAFSYVVLSIIVSIISIGGYAYGVSTYATTTTYTATTEAESYTYPPDDTLYPFVSEEIEEPVTESTPPPTPPPVTGTALPSGTDHNQLLSQILDIQNSTLLLLQTNLGRGGVSNYSDTDIDRLLKIVYGSNERTNDRVRDSIDAVTDGGVLTNSTLHNATIEGGTQSLDRLSINSNANALLAIQAPALGDPIGPNLITNGTFDTDASGWVLQSGCTFWENGQIRGINDATCQGDAWWVSAQTEVTLEPGTYALTFDLTSLSDGEGFYVDLYEGAINVYDTYLGASDSFFASGSYTFVFTASKPGTHAFYFGSWNYCDDCSWTLDNVFLYQLENNPIPAITITDYDGLSLLSLGGLVDTNRKVVIGRGAGYESTGLNQTAIGANAGYQNLGGSQSAFGLYAGSGNTAYGQSAFGAYAGYQNTQWGQSAFGEFAGYKNTGLRQSAFGRWAGINNTGAYQAAFGDSAGNDNTGGNQSVFGHRTGRENTGVSQSAFGLRAGEKNTGNHQTAMGQIAGELNTGNHQTAIGVNAGYQNTGNFQTTLGSNSGHSNTGDNTSFLGYEAGRGNTAHNVVALGYRAGRNNSLANQFIVQQQNINATPLIQGNFQTGNLGIGTIDPSSFRLQVAGNIGPNANNAFNLGSTALRFGCIWTSDGSSGTCASDETLKQDIETLTFTNPLEIVESLTLRTFSFINDPDRNTTLGLIAQEVELIAPDFVITQEDETKAVRYGALKWLMFEALQELIAKVNTLAQGVFESIVAGRIVADDIKSGGNIEADGAVRGQELCIGTTCVTEAELQALLNQQTGQGSVAPPPSPAPETEPEVTDQTPTDDEVTKEDTNNEAAIEPDDDLESPDDESDVVANEQNNDAEAQEGNSENDESSIGDSEESVEDTDQTDETSSEEDEESDDL